MCNAAILGWVDWVKVEYQAEVDVSPSRLETTIAGQSIIGLLLSIRTDDSASFFFLRRRIDFVPMRLEFPQLNWKFLKLSAQFLLIVGIMADSNPPKGLSTKLQNKRKRQADDTAPKQEKPEASTPAEGSTKKKQKKNKNKKKSIEQDAEQSSRKDGIDESIGKMDGRLLGDHFAQKAKRHEKELSAVELSDLSVPGMHTSINNLR